MTFYSYTTIDLPGSTVTFAQAINTAGEIVGFYKDSFFLEHGFLDINGTYTTFQVPGSTDTRPLGMNTSGEE